MNAQTRIVALGLAAALTTACTMKEQEAPPLTGPSEFGTSITVEASPDVLATDGGSQSIITISARDSNGKPMSNLSLKAETHVGGNAVDFGTLSARSLVTDGAGRATLRYTSPNITTGVDNNTHVEIGITPIGTNAANAVRRVTTIRLVPVGVVVPPDGLQPAFTFTPTSPADHQMVVFDGSSSQSPANNPIAEYRWNFGDGSTATGRSASHAFSAPGTYSVTLTISDALGRSATTQRTIQVGAGTGPAASGVFSPTSPLPGQAVQFDASASQAAPGRSIARYEWSFGDGTTGAGVRTAHSYAAVGNYIAVLVVTDDAGRSATTTLNVPVGTGALPTAAFVFSPATPRPAQPVMFNATASTAAAGRTITEYQWDFGDGQRGFGVQQSHVYMSAGTYTVVLAIVDSTGAKATTTQTLTVAADQPQASFTFSPTDPTPGTSVFFNAAASAAAPGRTIVQYIWDFGDGALAVSDSSGTTKVGGYAAVGTFVVTLTVVDDRGTRTTTSRTVTVKAP